MKKLKVAIWPKILLLLILLGLVFWFGWFIKGQNQKQEIKAPEQEKIIDDLSKETKVLQKIFQESVTEEVSGNGYEIKISKPKVTNPKVDSTINKFIEEEKSQIRSVIDEIDPEFSSDYVLQIDYVATFNNDYESLVFKVYNYTGGAHGNYYFKTYTFDKNGNEIKILDLVQEKKLPDLASLIIEKLLSSLPDDYLAENGEDWVREGVKPDEASLSFWAVEQSGIRFYFPPYQVGPWSLGSQEVFLSNSDLQKFFK